MAPPRLMLRLDAAVTIAAAEGLAADEVSGLSCAIVGFRIDEPKRTPEGAGPDDRASSGAVV